MSHARFAELSASYRVREVVFPEGYNIDGKERGVQFRVGRLKNPTLFDQSYRFWRIAGHLR